MTEYLKQPEQQDSRYLPPYKKEKKIKFGVNESKQIILLVNQTTAPKEKPQEEAGDKVVHTIQPKPQQVPSPRLKDQTMPLSDQQYDIICNEHEIDSAQSSSKKAPNTQTNSMMQPEGQINDGSHHHQSVRGDAQPDDRNKNYSSFERPVKLQTTKFMYHSLPTTNRIRFKKVNQKYMKRAEFHNGPCAEGGHMCSNCRIQKQRGDSMGPLDLSKIKQKQQREIALIRRFTQPKVKTENEQFNHTFLDGSHKINRFVQNPQNFAPSKNDEQQSKYTKTVNISGGLQKNNRQGKQRNIRRFLNTSAGLVQSDNQTMLSRPPTQGGYSMMSGSNDENTGDNRANLNSSTNKMVQSYYSNTQAGILSGYRSINPVDSFSHNFQSLSRRQNHHVDPSFINANQVMSQRGQRMAMSGFRTFQNNSQQVAAKRKQNRKTSTQQQVFSKMTDIGSILSNDHRKITELPTVKLEGMLGDGRMNQVNASKLSQQKQQQLSLQMKMSKKPLSLVQPYNHYQRPMSQVQDKRLAMVSSLMSTQRTTDKGILELKPQICSIPLIDKNDEYEALLKLNYQRNDQLQEMSTQINRDPNHDIMRHQNLSLNMAAIKEKNEQEYGFTKIIGRKNVKVDRSLTIESKTPDDESLIMKPLRIPGANMDSQRLQTGQDLYVSGRDCAREGTDTTEDNLISGRGGVEHMKSVSTAKVKKESKPGNVSNLYFDKSMNLDELLFGSEQITVRDQLYKESHRDPSIKLPISKEERAEVTRLFQRSQMEQNFYKFMQLSQDQPDKVREIVMLFTAYKNLDYKKFDNDSMQTSQRRDVLSNKEKQLGQTFNIEVRSNKDDIILSQQDIQRDTNLTPSPFETLKPIGGIGPSRKLSSNQDELNGFSTGWNHAERSARSNEKDTLRATQPSQVVNNPQKEDSKMQCYLPLKITNKELDQQIVQNTSREQANQNIELGLGAKHPRSIESSFQGKFPMSIGSSFVDPNIAHEEATFQENTDGNNSKGEQDLDTLESQRPHNQTVEDIAKAEGYTSQEETPSSKKAGKINGQKKSGTESPTRNVFLKQGSTAQSNETKPPLLKFNNDLVTNDEDQPAALIMVYHSQGDDEQEQNLPNFCNLNGENNTESRMQKLPNEVMTFGPNNTQTLVNSSLQTRTAGAQSKEGAAAAQNQASAKDEEGEDQMGMFLPNAINQNVRRQAMTTQPRSRNMVIAQNQQRNTSYHKSTYQQSLETRRRELKEQLIKILVSSKSNVAGGGHETPKTPNSYFELINWQEPTDNDLLYLMQMQVRGLDAQGDAISKPDTYLTNISNLYLSRQNMLPTNQYILTNLDRAQLKRSVYFNYFDMQKIEAPEEDVKSKYKVQKLNFDRKKYKKEKQELHLKKIEVLQKNLELTLRQANGDQSKTDRNETASIRESSLQQALDSSINQEDRRKIMNSSQFKDHALIKNAKDVKPPIVSESPMIQIGTVREMNAALLATQQTLVMSNFDSQGNRDGSQSPKLDELLPELDQLAELSKSKVQATQEPTKILIKTLSGAKKGNASPRPKGSDAKTRKVIEELTIQGKKISAINSSPSGSPTPKGFKDSAVTKTQPSVDKSALIESPNSKILGGLQVEKIKVSDSRDMGHDSPNKGPVQPATPVDSLLTKIEDENEESQMHGGEAIQQQVAEFKLENDQVNIGEKSYDVQEQQKDFAFQTMEKGDSTFSDGGSKAQLKPRSPGRDLKDQSLKLGNTIKMSKVDVEAIATTLRLEQNIGIDESLSIPNIQGADNSSKPTTQEHDMKGSETPTRRSIVFGRHQKKDDNNFTLTVITNEQGVQNIVNQQLLTSKTPKDSSEPTDTMRKRIRPPIKNEDDKSRDCTMNRVKETSRDETVEIRDVAKAVYLSTPISTEQFRQPTMDGVVVINSLQQTSPKDQLAAPPQKSKNINLINTQLTNLIELQQEYLDLKDSLRSSYQTTKNNSPLNQQHSILLNDEQVDSRMQYMDRFAGGPNPRNLDLGLQLFNLPIDISILQDPASCLVSPTNMSTRSISQLGNFKSLITEKQSKRDNKNFLVTKCQKQMRRQERFKFLGYRGGSSGPAAGASGAAQAGESSAGAKRVLGSQGTSSALGNMHGRYNKGPGQGIWEFARNKAPNVVVEVLTEREKESSRRGTMDGVQSQQFATCEDGSGVRNQVFKAVKNNVFRPEPAKPYEGSRYEQWLMDRPNKGSVYLPKAQKRRSESLYPSTVQEGSSTKQGSQHNAPVGHSGEPAALLQQLQRIEQQKLRYKRGSAIAASVMPTPYQEESFIVSQRTGASVGSSRKMAGKFTVTHSTEKEVSPRKYSPRKHQK